MSNVRTIVLDDAVIDAIQQADIEQSARMEVLSRCIERGMDMTSDTFQQYQKEYNMWFAKFSELKQGIERDFVNTTTSPNGAAPTRWSLDYHTKTLTITY